MPDTIYWYDFETSGLDPVADRPLQFAGLRTDLALRPAGSPTTLYCRLTEEVQPSPEALLVSGIRVGRLQREGLRELAFLERINGEFSVPGTCVAGYNNLRFDDEFTRNALYRNLFDPYAREWREGNSRWDVIDLFRTAHALRPDGMEWPCDARGIASFRLEELTRANGIEHEGAHDALADVRATVALTARLRQRQPRLYDYLFNLREKRRVLDQLYPLGKSAIVHVSGMYPAASGCLAIVLPLCVHPTNSNGIVVYDLSIEPTPLIRLPAEEIHRLLFTPRDDLPEGDERIPLKTLHINRSPAVAPLTTLSEETCSRFGLDRGQCLAHMENLQHAAGVVEKIQDALSLSQFPPRDDPDHMLYDGGFFSQHDRDLLDRVRRSAPEKGDSPELTFDDARLPEMVFRFRARNFPETLDPEERARWHAFVRQRWGGADGARAYRERLASVAALHGDAPRASAIIEDLEEYVAGIWRSVGGA